MLEFTHGGGDSYQCRYGGDTFNAAQYLAWLSESDHDLTVQYMTAVGCDSLSTSMVNRWEENGVNTALVMRHPDRLSGLYFANTNENGDRDYLFYRSASAAKEMLKLPESEACLAKAAASDLIYSSAISLMILDNSDREKLVELFQKGHAAGQTTAFDTNFRPSGWDGHEEAAQWIDRIAPFVSLLFPTDDDCAAIYPALDSNQMADHFLSLGAATVIMKRGIKGCTIHNAETRFDVTTEANSAPLDTTAAGDSFNAAFLYTHLTGGTLADAARTGNMLAGEVINHRGALAPRERVTQLRAALVPER